MPASWSAGLTKAATPVSSSAGADGDLGEARPHRRAAAQPNKPGRSGRAALAAMTPQRGRQAAGTRNVVTSAPTAPPDAGRDIIGDVFAFISPTAGTSPSTLRYGSIKVRDMRPTETGTRLVFAGPGCRQLRGRDGRDRLPRHSPRPRD